jgi:predicted nucleic acid-binding protein
MTRFVIDPATLVQLVGEDLTVGADHQLVAPNAIRSQSLDLLYQMVRAGTLSEPEALRQHDRMTELTMRLLGDRVSRRTAWRIATERGWDTLRNADYLAVTMLQADALVTADPDLATKTRGIVPLAPFAELLG